MPKLNLQTNPAPGTVSRREDRRPFRHIMACLDRSPDTEQILRQADLLADMFGAELTAIRVLPRAPTATPCTDPVDWELQKREEIDDLHRLADSVGAGAHAKAAVGCGSVSRCILEEAENKHADLLAVGTGSFGTPEHWSLGGNTRHLVESFSGSLLVVPNRAIDEPDPKRRVIVPIDGSPQAEAALRLASAIAGHRSAELVILHATPDIELSRGGRPEPHDEALRRELLERAERGGADLLRRVARLVPADAHRSRVRHLSGEEPRRALMRAICEERGELVVMSARGLGANLDVPIGSTADYLLSHAVTPILMIRKAEPVAHRVAGLAPRRQTAAGRRE